MIDIRKIQESSAPPLGLYYQILGALKMYVYTWFRLAHCLPLSRRLKRGCNSCPFLLRSLYLGRLQDMLGCLTNYSCLTIRELDLSSTNRWPKRRILASRWMMMEMIEVGLAFLQTPTCIYKIEEVTVFHHTDRPKPANNMFISFLAVNGFSSRL